MLKLIHSNDDDEEERVEAPEYASQSGEAALVESPEQWRWGGYRSYLLEEAGPVRVMRDDLRSRSGIERRSCAAASVCGTRPLQSAQRTGHPPCVGHFGKIKSWATRPFT